VSWRFRRSKFTEQRWWPDASSFEQEVARVESEVDRIEADTLRQVEHNSLDRQAQVRTLEKLLLFDKWSYECGA
jgi:hypothetical protein